MRNRLDHELYDRCDDGGQCFYEDGNRVQETLCQTGDKLQRRVEQKRQILNQSLGNGSDHLHDSRDQRGQRFPDPLGEHGNHLDCGLNQNWEVFHDPVNQCHKELKGALGQLGQRGDEPVQKLHHDPHAAFDQSGKVIYQSAGNGADDLRAQRKEHRQLLRDHACNASHGGTDGVTDLLKVSVRRVDLVR